MKPKLFLLLFAIVASIGITFASDTQVNGIWYDFDSNTLTAKVTYRGADYDSYSGEYSGMVAIPASVTYSGKTYSVTSIGEAAFYNCSGLTSVTIPNSVTSIGNSAFDNCGGLTSIEIPNSVTSIGGAAFSDCSGLISVTIPNSVTSIGGSAFYGCTSLTSISIPNSVTSIEKYAFEGCSGLTSVIIPNSVISIKYNAFSGVLNVIYSGSASGAPWGAKCYNGFVDGWLCYSDNTKTELLGCAQSATGEIAIPNSVTSIGDYAFKGCSGLTSVTIPNSVTSIGDYAFNGCSGLTSVTIPNRVTSIGIWAFEYCSSLTSVTIPNSVTSIGQGAFSECSSLPVIDNLRYADDWYLIEAVDKTLDTYTIKDGTKWIGIDAFHSCTSMTSITIPNSVTSIGESAFIMCTSLISITIPNSVTSIGAVAFFECSSLTSVTIPNSVTSIGAAAFSYCSSLTNIYVDCGDLDRIKQLLDNDSRVKYVPLPYSIIVNAKHGYVNTPQNICDALELSAIPNYGYHFFQWSDGNTDNPRKIELTQDTSFTAIFAPNKYSINVSCDGKQGSIVGENGSFDYLTTHTYEAIPNYGYHFVCWSDSTYVCDDGWNDYCWAGHWVYNTNPQRRITITQDTVITAIFEPNIYTVSPMTNTLGSISGTGQFAYLTECTVTANPNYGYHFVRWSDGETVNPRTFVLTQDTIFAAEFAPNQYSINVSCDDKQGSVVGENGSFDYLTEKTYETTPNYGYHFVRWSDREYVCDDYWNDYCWSGHWVDITTPQRTVTITQDTVITAIFEPNIYTVSPMANTWGSISGTGQFAYLTECTITANPNYGYHFVRWSDGETANPRTFVLTQDTIFAAEYAIDKSGTCGDDLALRWEYDTNGKVLTISGSGTLNSNYLFGVEAPDAMEKLIIAEGVTTIGNSAFAGFETLKHISIPASVKTVYEQAFYNCTGLQEIYSYRDKPSVAYSNSFDGIDKFECTLHVLSASVDMYKAATGWRDFYYIQTIDAEAVTEPIEDVSVTPSVTTAAIAWPSVENAATYELTIKDKNGNVVCTLVFNAQGQLTSIAFAAPSRSQQSTQAAGFSFTVTGLDSGSNYGFTIDAKDGNGNIIDTKSGSFETTSDISTGIDNLDATIAPVKVFRNGQLFILRGDKTYTVQGQEVR